MLFIIPTQVLNAALSLPLDVCRQACWNIASRLIGQGRSVLAYFQNQDKTVHLLDICMATIYNLAQDAAYQAIKKQSDKVEAFPQEKMFNFLCSRAPKIVKK
jgi:hypothetical protein